MFGLTGTFGAISAFFVNRAQIVSVSASRARAYATGDVPGEWRIARTGDRSVELRLRYSIGGDARPGRDFAPLSGYAIIPVGAEAVVLSLAALPTALDDRTVILSLVPDPPHVFVGCPSQSLIVIRQP